MDSAARRAPTRLGAALGTGVAAAIASRGDCAGLPPPSRRIVRVADEDALQAAILALRSGTTVLLERGVYELASTLHVRGVTDVAIRGATGSREDVVLVGRGMEAYDHGGVPHGILISASQGVLIADLTIRDVPYHAVQIQGETGASDVALYRVRLMDTGEQLVKGSSAGPPGPYADDGAVACSHLGYTDRAPSDYTNGVDVLAGARWTVRDTSFVRIRAPVGDLAGPAVLFWRGASDVLVERNRFIDCDRGVALGLSAPDPAFARAGTAPYDALAATAWNNFVWRSAGSPTGDIGIAAANAADFAIAHNTVLLNGTFPLGAIEARFEPSFGTIVNNLSDAPVWRRDGATILQAGNMADADPAWFADPEIGDLHLSAGAAALDASALPEDPPDGHASAGAVRVPMVDIDRQPRPPAGTGLRDVGADEHVAQIGLPRTSR